MRMLIGAANPPREAFLVLQHEAAMRWAGFEGESIASLSAKIRFTFDVRLALRRRDFRPFPAVDCLLLAVTRRSRPVLTARDEVAFTRLLNRGFRGGRGSLRKNLDPLVSRSRFQALARDADFAPESSPGNLTFEQWLAVFRATARRL
jgi:16S rRNA A1518/A1519 N6-dimethyltransferase RsmA/KsgA/DIM1 with predicted DNA glycosylase/AP lyase activity